MPQTAMARVKRKAAEPIEDRPALMDLDRQEVMGSMADHDVGPGVDRGMADLGHIVKHLAADSPMTGSYDDIRLAAQRRDVLGEPLQISLVGPGQDLRR